MHTAVATIDRQRLLDKLERHDPFHLVMASSDWAFGAKHIPGSEHFHSRAELFQAIPKDAEVVVYCSNADCNASLTLYQVLADEGYSRLLHYPGGLIEWEAAGLPLEGTWVDPAPPARRP